MAIYTYMYNGNVQQNPLCAGSCVTNISTSLPGSRLRILSRCILSVSTRYVQQCRIYAQNPVFEIVNEQSAKAYLFTHTYSVLKNNIIGSMKVFVQLVWRHKIFTLHQGLYGTVYGSVYGSVQHLIRRSTSL